MMMKVKGYFVSRVFVMLQANNMFNNNNVIDMYSTHNVGTYKSALNFGR